MAIAPENFLNCPFRTENTMDCPRIPMSYEAFDTIEHILGWKTEYWDGYARLTPRPMGIETCLTFETFTPTKTVNAPKLTFITPTADYAQAMLDCYIAAFINSVEFCGWPTDRIFEEAQQDLSLYFKGKRGKPLPASVIAIEPQTGDVVGTALVTNKEEKGACLGLLYVRPSHHRKGIGTHVITRSVEILTRQGYSQLTSRYHICNHQSRQFYHQLGFEDRHDRYYLRTYTAWLGHEIYRREKLKMLDDLEKMKQEQKQLQEKLEKLEEAFTRSVHEAI
ncbi:MAG: GNAT family N-acetyltransferase [Cyanobacteria bacterium J06621_3]